MEKEKLFPGTEIGIQYSLILTIAYLHLVTLQLFRDGF